jgi:hypothetical protein
MTNADTVYAMGFLDLTDGPIVLEVPPRLLGMIDDAWHRWVIDIGLSGPDRGLGGKHLILPPGYDGPLPKGIPARKFWALTVYDNQTRTMLDTPQRYPRAGSQSYPSPAAQPNADGSTTVYFALAQPEGVSRGNWIQTLPGRGWFVWLRLYGPLEPFFDKSWRPGEIELVP